MRLNNFAPILLIAFSCIAHAAIEVVPELSETNSVHTAPIIHKNAIYTEVVQHVPRTVCRNTVQSRHFDSRGTIELVHRDNQICRQEIHREIFKVLKGYEVVYSYNGVLMKAFFDHDPGNFVSVNSGQ
jgi:uncharacterized protein YcfJ